MKSYQRITQAAVLSLATLLFLNGCARVPVTGRSQLNLVSAGEEAKLGLTAFDQLKQETPINHDPVINERVQRVGRRIAAIADKDMPNAQWEFVVFESAEANAFCLPGGKVGVYTGLLKIAQDDAGLATVIGHEVAHAVARHGAERMSEAMLTQTGGQVIGSALSDHASPMTQQAVLLAYGAGAKLGRELPHSRAQELEADHIGLMYMARAGYNPESAIHFWERFAASNNQSAGGIAQFLSTHPVDHVRIEKLRELLPQAEAEFMRNPIR